jgi:hypothetical protein
MDHSRTLSVIAAGAVLVGLFERELSTGAAIILLCTLAATSIATSLEFNKSVYQFSVRTLLVTTTLIAVVLGLIACASG